MQINIQPILENDMVALYPLTEEDFDTMYLAASDPEIWEQHPNQDRWQKEVFKVFFEGAIQSKGAFKIVEKSTKRVIGSSRYYDLDMDKSVILIGYTFYAKAFWGKGINFSVKKMMLDYIFMYVSKVHFHIGANNIRSQIAIGRLGAQKIAEIKVAYYGETPKVNIVYEITKEAWLTFQA